MTRRHAEQLSVQILEIVFEVLADHVEQVRATAT
jgi:hypothetical protein